MKDKDDPLELGLWTRSVSGRKVDSDRIDIMRSSGVTTATTDAVDSAIKTGHSKTRTGLRLISTHRPSPPLHVVHVDGLCERPIHRDTSNAIDLPIKNGGSSTAPVSRDGDDDPIVDKGPRNRVVSVDRLDVLISGASPDKVDEPSILDRREGVPGPGESAEISPDISNGIVHGHRIVAQSSKAEDLVIMDSRSKVSSSSGHVATCVPLASGRMIELKFGGENLLSIFQFDTSKTDDIVHETDGCCSATRGGHFDQVLPGLGAEVVDLEVLVDENASGSSEAVEDVLVRNQRQETSLAADGRLDCP